MAIQAEIDFFIDQLFDHAVQSFRQTRQGELLTEQRGEMDKRCASMLSSGEQKFAEECFGLLLGAAGEEEYFVYRQGMRDCVALLKTLGVLA